MKLNYYQDTDSLYIDLSSKKSSKSVEVSVGIIIDYDKDGEIVGIDIDNASSKMNLTELVLNKIPAQVHKISA